MIIKSVTLENFRSFYGEQKINFSTDPQRNTTVIYALNGVGKTNLLNSILWCLHDMFTPGFKGVKDILNWQAEKQGRKSYHVTVDFEEDGVNYSVKRSGGEISNFKVFKIVNGNFIELPRKELFVNKILPKDMAGYFISDGEGSDLTVDANGLISVKRSIRDILGFNVAEKTVEDLNRIKNEVRSELKRFDMDTELSNLEQSIQGKDTDIQYSRKSLEENLLALEGYTLKFDQIEIELGDGSSQVVDQKIKRRSQIERQIKEISEELKNLEKNKIKLIREYSWVAFSKNLSNNALDFIDESELQGKIPAPFNTQLVKDIIKESTCICGACIEPGTVAFENIQALLQTAADPSLLSRLHKARSMLTKIKTLLPIAKDRLDENYKNISLLQARLETLTEEELALTTEIGENNSDLVRSLERKRTVYRSKIHETERSINRLTLALSTLKSDKEGLDGQIKRIKVHSPRAKLLKEKINFINSIVERINEELIDAEQSIHGVLEAKINEFLAAYLRQDYTVTMSKEFKIGLVDRNNRQVPPGGGQGAILSFIYISSLISIARERRDLKSSILTPGAIAPLIFDAPFSKLDPKYAPNIARELPKLVDQLIILMYQDEGKCVDATLIEEGRLGRLYCFTEEIAGEQAGKPLQTLNIAGTEVPVTMYGSNIDRVIVKEILNYD